MEKPRIWHFAAAIAPATKAAGSRFAGVAYSGNQIPQWNAIIDLASTRIEESMPVLFAHDRSTVIGVVESAVNDGRSLALAGMLHADIDAKAAEVVAKAARGSRWQMSVGLFDSTETRVPAGEFAAVNGRRFPGPVALLCGGVVREVSVVALGADPQTGVVLLAAGGRLAREEVSPLVADAMHRAALAAAASGAWR